MPGRRLVACDTDQAQPRRRRGRASHLVDGSCPRQPVRPPGRPTSTQTSTGRRAPAADNAEVISETPRSESTQQTARNRHRASNSPASQRNPASSTNSLARITRAHAECAIDPQLADRRDRDAARPRLELAGEQLRRHVRLAVWRQLDAPVAAPRRHRRHVVRQGRIIEHAQRPDRAFGQRSWPFGATSAGVRPHHDDGMPL